MIKSSKSFMFNGQLSTDYGITNVTVGSGSGSLPYSEEFLPQIQLKETLVRRHKIPYIYEIRHLPAEFKLQIAYEDATRLPEIARLFNVSYYAPMIFLDEIPQRVYYVMPNNSPTLFHQGQLGYIEMDFRNSSPYAYSPVITTQLYDLSSNIIGGKNITFRNQGDISLHPVIIATVGSGGTFTITNTTNNNMFIGFTNLIQSEVVTIDCDREDILSSLSPDPYRYNNLISGSEVNFEMLVGTNTLNVTGNCTLQFMYEYVILQSPT